MGRELKSSREKILTVINANTFMLRTLWEKVYGEKIDDEKWSKIQSLVNDKMRQ